MISGIFVVMINNITLNEKAESFGLNFCILNIREGRKQLESRF